jgi:hypothetical protein
VRFGRWLGLIITPLPTIKRKGGSGIEAIKVLVTGSRTGRSFDKQN